MAFGGLRKEVAGMAGDLFLRQQVTELREGSSERQEEDVRNARGLRCVDDSWKSSFSVPS
jgi:hypothetical protein